VEVPRYAGSERSRDAGLWRGRNHVIKGLVEWFQFVGKNYSCFPENIEERIIKEKEISPHTSLIGQVWNQRCSL